MSAFNIIVKLHILNILFPVIEKSISPYCLYYRYKEKNIKFQGLSKSLWISYYLPEQNLLADEDVDFEFPFYLLQQNQLADVQVQNSEQDDQIS